MSESVVNEVLSINPKIIVYSAIFKRFDRLRSVSDRNGAEYVHFTDKKQPTTGWNCIIPPRTTKNHRRENRRYKCLSHKWFPTADWTIYIDGNLKLKVSPNVIINICKNVSKSASIFIFPHKERNCVYLEAGICAQLGLDTTSILVSQIERYRSEGFPENYGLFWGGMIVRRSGCEEFNELWWDEIQKGSCRDQISLPFVLWKTGIEAGILDYDVPFYGRESLFVDIFPHNERRTRK